MRSSCTTFTDEAGRIHEYWLADRRVRIPYRDGKRHRRFAARQITRLDPQTGHQTQIITTRDDPDPAALARTRGALNLYARYPAAFGIVDRAKAMILASLAGVALSSADVREEQERRIDNLEVALVSRELIGRAEGILMERERITSDQAFDLLRRASQHLNVKLRDVARNVVETGEVPPSGGSPAPPR